MKLRRWIPKFPRPQVTPWLITCCVLAAPIVYLFEQQFYEVAVVTFWSINRVIQLGMSFIDSFKAPINRRTGQDQLILVPLLILAGLAFSVIALSVVLVTVIPYTLAAWLVSNPGLPRYTLDLILVWYLGVFLYGVLFPLLWRALEPLIAHTLGEVAFRRARARVYGDRPRYAQPFYLAVAIIGVASGTLRIATPMAGAAAGSVSQAWHDVSDPVLHPQWPKTFRVAHGVSVPTNIHLQPNEELSFYADGPVDASVGPGGYHFQLPSGQRSRPWGFEGRAGDLYFWGRSRTVTVVVYGPPENHGHVWQAMPTPTPQRAAARKHRRHAGGHQ